jgi:hypothetical protein
LESDGRHSSQALPLKGDVLYINLIIFMIKNFVLGAIIIGYYREHQFNALKGHDISAQGNALCNRIGVKWSPERAI